MHRPPPMRFTTLAHFHAQRGRGEVAALFFERVRLRVIPGGLAQGGNESQGQGGERQAERAGA